MNFSMNIPLFKIDEEQKLVYARATQEVLDKANEIMDYESSKPYFEKWSNDFATRTNGKSYGNIRVQHDSKRVGGKIAEPLVFNDVDKAIDVCIKVSDDKLFEEIKEGYYTGVSVGGSYGKQWKDESGITHYTAIPSECSIVDNPAVPTATIMYVKADGTTEEKTFNKKEVSNVDKEKETQVEVEKPADTEVKAEETVEKAESAETVEKTAVEIEPKQEEEVEEEAKKADEPAEEESDDKDDEKEVEKSAEVAKEDVFEMCSKAMDNADDSVKEKCGKLFHKMVEKGLYCKCGKCAKAIEGEKAEKAAADNDLHKAVSNEGEAMQKFAPADELAKAMGIIDELKKGFDALKSDNDALKKQVEKLENEPVAGGAIMANGTMALDKTIGGSMGNAPVNTSESDVLRKMIDETDSATLKEEYSKRLAILEMKKVF